MSEANVRAILLDIEGTTTPIEFVYKVLFPYARRQVREFVHEHYHSESLQPDILALKAEHRSDREQGHQPPEWSGDSVDDQVEASTQYVYWLMEQDRKSKALKSLQGKIWEGGYLDGSLQGQVYPDVLPAFKRWREQQRSIHIYSSGSVLAQKLLFAHTTDGDLTNYLNGYFDTGVGAKAEASSYQVIANEIRSAAAGILFVSDVSAELDAARTAGMVTALCVRLGGSGPKDSPHQIVRTFGVIFP
ncbi:MAG TPA: acireductone synthase [Pyrinomonadaceae bacterium]|nr:acireductone synthase [Pyrinomonadaceae bacterium]